MRRDLLLLLIATFNVVAWSSTNILCNTVQEQLRHIHTYIYTHTSHGDLNLSRLNRVVNTAVKGYIHKQERKRDVAKHPSVAYEWILNASAAQWQSKAKSR